MTARLLTIFAGLVLAAQQLQVQADVEKRTVAVGEPFLFQIRIDGSDAPAKPDLSGLADFSVEELGSQQTSSESVSVVEGNRVRRETRRGRIYSYRLAARKTGALVIPAIPVTLGGRQLRTAPIQIRVLAPVEDPDLKLRMTLSSKRLYVGEPAVLTLTWYIGRAVRDFRFDLPFVADRRFRFADPPVRFDPARHVEVAIGGSRVLAEKGTGRINGREMATLTLRKILIPLEPGSLALAPATVAGEVIRGTSSRRAPSLFDELFGEGFFEFGREPLVESFSVASGSLPVAVRPLPEAGRPAGFTGLVGEFRLAAQAHPAEVTVGDPITLTLRVSGPEYVGHVELPPLTRQPELARDFKVPEEAPFGELEDGAKKFTEIIRVMNPGVSRIPPIELAYFNPRTGRYEVARTDPIPLTVREARIVTAQDAEGAGGPAGQSEIASREGGIAHNYEGPEVLVNAPAGPETWLESRRWLALVLLPPLLYFGLLAARALARRRADETRQRAGGAFKRLARRLRSLEEGGSDGAYSVLLDGLRRYFRDRFGLPAGALTFRDLKPVLEERGVAPETIEAVGKLFERCEAGHYAGAPVAGADPPDLVREALETAEKVERTLP